MPEEKGPPDLSPSEMGKKQGELAQFLRDLFNLTWEQRAAVLILVAAAAGVVWWFAGRHLDETKDSQITASRLETLEKTSQLLQQNAELKLENRDLTRDVARQLKELGEAVNELKKTPPKWTGFLSPDEDLPPLDSTPFDPTTMDEFLKWQAREREENKTKTQIQQPQIYRQFQGHRFRWTGFLGNVWEHNRETLALLLLPTRKETQGPTPVYGPSMECFFAKKEHIVELSELDIGRRITIEGVMSENGSLGRCKLLPSPPEPLAPPPPPGEPQVKRPAPAPPPPEQPQFKPKPFAPPLPPPGST